MKKATTFKDVILKWPSKSDLATDVGVPEATVLNWYYRNRIPVEHWADVLDAADDRGLKFDDRDFVQIASLGKQE